MTLIWIETLMVSCSLVRKAPNLCLSLAISPRQTLSILPFVNTISEHWIELPTSMTCLNLTCCQRLCSNFISTTKSFLIHTIEMGLPFSSWFLPLSYHPLFFAFNFTLLTAYFVSYILDCKLLIVEPCAFIFEALLVSSMDMIAGVQ